eukprot:1162867-Pyramimonas_sp.AAC.1
MQRRRRNRRITGERRRETEKRRMEEHKNWTASGGAIEAQCWETWCYVAFWGLMGVFLGPLWIPLRASMGFSCVVSGRFWAVLGRLGGLWPSWGSPGG